MNRDQIINLSLHCACLSELVSELSSCRGEHDRQITTRDGEVLDWSDVSEWLYIAASVRDVEIDTARFDPSIMLCGRALDFQVERSELLSELISQLTIFNFAWGALETTIKLIDPPRVPRALKPRSSLIDNAVFFLKKNHQPANSNRPIAFYGQVVANLRQTLKALPYYGNLSQDFKLQPFMDVSGVGVHVVRKIRNKFAHGTFTLPLPSDKAGSDEHFDIQLVMLSTRVIIMTIQMLLLAYLEEDEFPVECLRDEDGFPIQESVHVVLKVLHIQTGAVHKDQLSLL